MKVRVLVLLVFSPNKTREMQKTKVSNLMAPPLLGGGGESGRRLGYQPITESTMAVEETTQSMRERLPGRSKKAKDQFRRQQRGERGNEWRGRLSGYCPSDSVDCEKLTKHLKERANDDNLFFTSLLYMRKWRVKAYFDVLHLHSPASPSSSNETSMLMQQDSDGEQNQVIPRDGCEFLPFFQTGQLTPHCNTS